MTDGYARACKPCKNADNYARFMRDKDKHRADRRKAYAALPPEKKRYINRQVVLCRYGLTVHEYDAMYEACGGRCESCGNKEDTLNVDHDHSCCPGTKTCGKCIRGLLCRACNWMVGHSHEDVAQIRSCADYIERVNLGR